MLKRIFTGVVLASLVAPVGTAQDSQWEQVAYKRGDATIAPGGLPPLAVKGDSKAQHKLAFMYLRGEGVPRDGTKAVEWFRKAAEQGHIRAQYNLAILYHIGFGVRQNDAKAEEWFSKAAERGHGAAKTTLIFMRENGRHLARKVPPAPARRDGGVQLAVQEKSQGLATEVAPEAAPRDVGVALPVQGNIQRVATKTAPVVPRGDFRVQLAAVKMEARAVKEAGRLNRAHKLILGNLKIVPVRASLGQGGFIYRLRAGPLDDLASANALCRKLSARNQGCMVTGR